MCVHISPSLPFHPIPPTTNCSNFLSSIYIPPFCFSPLSSLLPSSPGPLLSFPLPLFSQATHLIRAVGTLLDFNSQEEQFVKDYFDYKVDTQHTHTHKHMHTYIHTYNVHIHTHNVLLYGKVHPIYCSLEDIIWGIPTVKGHFMILIHTCIVLCIIMHTYSMCTAYIPIE